MTARPLALTMGDPAGIGPEIVAAAWRRLSAGAAAPALVVCGDPDVMAAYAPVHLLAGPEALGGAFPADRLCVLETGRCTAPVVAGRPDPAHAPAILGAIRAAVSLALAGQVRGIVTAPIAKEPLYKAGFTSPGHTEFLGELTAHAPVDGPRGPVMMLAGGDLRVALATVHAPLARVPGLLSTRGLIDLGRLVHHALVRDFGLARPRIAVAGLNPHAGEGGSIGTEEATVIAPAVAALAAEGLDVRGPASADTLFHPEARATHDAVICMYHDQGLIPLKMLAFWSGVNVTLGLPVVRTSPDHGTGFDIAGRGLARADSLLAAIALADSIASHRGLA